MKSRSKASSKGVGLATIYWYWFLIWFLVPCLAEAATTSATTPRPDDGCFGEAAEVCRSDGNGTVQRDAIRNAFPQEQQIDIVFLICNTSDCRKANATLKDFIIQLMNNVFGECNVRDNRVRFSVVTYDFLSVYVSYNGLRNPPQNSDSCQTNDVIRSLPFNPQNTTGEICRVTDALNLANEVFANYSRNSAKKVLWLFSDLYLCAGRWSESPSDGNYKYSQVKADIQRSADAIKNTNNADVFTVGITKCGGSESGYYDSLDKEELMRTIATNPAHYACIESWSNFIVSPVRTTSAPSTKSSARGDQSSVDVLKLIIALGVVVIVVALNRRRDSVHPQVPQIGIPSRKPPPPIPSKNAPYNDEEKEEIEFEERFLECLAVETLCTDG